MSDLNSISNRQLAKPNIIHSELEGPMGNTRLPWRRSLKSRRSLWRRKSLLNNVWYVFHVNFIIPDVVTIVNQRWSKKANKCEKMQQNCIFLCNLSVLSDLSIISKTK